MGLTMYPQILNITCDNSRCDCHPQVDVPIRIHNADTAVITFTGAGYDQRAMGETMPFNDRIGDSNVPLQQLIHPTGQVITTSSPLECVSVTGPLLCINTLTMRHYKCITSLCRGQLISFCDLLICIR